MKFVTLLLLCATAVAATENKEVIECPTAFEEWSSAEDLKPVSKDDHYAYELPIKKEWFTASFYADSLPAFPQTLAESCEAESPDLMGCVSSYETRLLEARVPVEDELNAALGEYRARIVQLHATFVTTFRDNLKLTIADEESDEFVTAVAEYEAELNEIEARAVGKYLADINATLDRVQVVHDRLIADFHKCLETRAERMAEYNSKMDARTDKYVEQYELVLKQQNTARVQWVRCVFDNLYADDEKTTAESAATTENADESVDAVAKKDRFQDFMSIYECILTNQIAPLSSEFRAKVNEATDQLKDVYRCNYKCYFNTGCYGFSRVAVAKKSVRIPSPPRTGFKKVALGAFKVEWKGAEYKSLKTCSAEERKGAEFNEAAHIEKIEADAVAMKSELECKTKAWQVQVAEWKTTIDAALQEQLSTLVPKKPEGEEASEDEIAALRSTVECQAKRWIALVEEQLQLRLTCFSSRIGRRIEGWRAASLAHVDHVREAHGKCNEQRMSRIASYRECLEKRIADTRACFAARLEKMAGEHKCRFDGFYAAAFGGLECEELFSEMKTSYHAHVDGKVAAVLADFDRYWALVRPQLEQHYECGARCKAEVRPVCFDSSYEWDMCAPQLDLELFTC